MAQNERLSVRDDDQKLRETACEINSLLTGGASNDYAGGVRYALLRTLEELKRETKRQQRREAAKEQTK